MVYRETKREGRQLQCPKCKDKVDWEDTKAGKEEAAKEAEAAAQEAMLKALIRH